MRAPLEHMRERATRAPRQRLVGQFKKTERTIEEKKFFVGIVAL